MCQSNLVYRIWFFPKYGTKGVWAQTDPGATAAAAAGTRLVIDETFAELALGGAEGAFNVAPADWRLAELTGLDVVSASHYDGGTATAVLCGDSGLIGRTTDYGASWTVVPSGTARETRARPIHSPSAGL